MKELLSIQISGFEKLKIQFLPDNVINVISSEPLSEQGLRTVVKYLHREGFCDEAEIEDN